MSKCLLLFLFPFAPSILVSQSGAEVAACLRTCLQAPEMEAAFTREWGELRPLYLRQPTAPGIGHRPLEEGAYRLTAADFQGLPWEVIPVTEAEARQLPAEEARFGILEAGVSVRKDRATVNLFVNLPDAPRKWMSASFLLEQEGGQWAVLQKSIEIRP